MFVCWGSLGLLVFSGTRILLLLDFCGRELIYGEGVSVVRF